MGTPFMHQPEAADQFVTPATAAQIERAIVPMIRDRAWNSDANVADQPKYVSRVAALHVVFAFVTGEIPVPADNAALRAAVADDADLGVRVNRVLALLVADARPGYEFAYAVLTKQGASKLIEWLAAQPFKSQAREVEAAFDRSEAIDKIAAAAAPEVTSYRSDEVPAGRYAIDTAEGAINEVAFYRVDRPESGKWAGFVFVKHIVGDDEQRLGKAQGHKIIDRIAEVGAEAASARYGHEIGECGICGRQLTNDDSRERGIGPVCARKVGW
ncbi:hypothetical protein PBI_THONKO_45 [Mycobacterium phage Thonko]|uniref:Uncharacterized protein n=1 Tax=Mycobacterium phage Thonko TaxID=2282910 RepID=A0A346FC92_9CAUD|nr:hypothetical protein I5G57_gp045 [Mycobacterium phage Thonko]AXN53317.1 hypothetical protein PBI_THONKO_45 [Mycobacterium phage Thonko]